MGEPSDHQPLRQDCSHSGVRGVHPDNELVGGIRKNESVPLTHQTPEWSTLGGERSCHRTVVQNKTSIEVGKAQEALKLLTSRRSTLVGDRPGLGRIHLYVTSVEDIIQECHPGKQKQRADLVGHR